MIENLTYKLRFPRIFLTGVLRELKPIQGCRVIWPSGFKSDVFDFGRSSASMYFPMRLGLNFNKGDLVKLGFEFGSAENAVVLDGRVIRGESRLLTLELYRLTQSEIKKIESCFTDEFIAKHMQNVLPEHFSPEQTFSLWLHGPLDTNLYVYCGIDGINRVNLELGDHVLVWDSHGIMIGPSRDTLSYPTEDYAYYTNFLAPLAEATAKDKVVQRMVKFLTQIECQSPIVSEVIKKLNEAR